MLRGHLYEYGPNIYKEHNTMQQNNTLIFHMQQ